MNKVEYIKKEELIRRISEMSGVPKGSCALVMAAFCEVAKEAMKDGKGVQLVGFAKLFPVYKEARRVRNPITGEEIEIKAQVSARMLPLVALKNALNGKET